MGRRKIEIKAIKDDRNRSVTFLKRKGGLFKKAHELSVLCSVDVAVIIFGNNKKLYEYSSSDIGEILQRHNFYGGANEHKGPSDFNGKRDDDDDDDEGSVMDEGHPSLGFTTGTERRAFPKYTAPAHTAATTAGIAASVKECSSSRKLESSTAAYAARPSAFAAYERLLVVYAATPGSTPGDPTAAAAAAAAVISVSGPAAAISPAPAGVYGRPAPVVNASRVSKARTSGFGAYEYTPATTTASNTSSAAAAPTTAPTSTAPTAAAAAAATTSTGTSTSPATTSISSATPPTAAAAAATPTVSHGADARAKTH
ncbi:hypothetical protein V494_07204, partial [Pseudogymnoascus sp. VKM F-4513 (FW-928)]